MKPRFSLIAKFTLSTSLILLVFMGLLDNINLKNFRKAMINFAASNAEQVADIITHSTYDAMMKNDKDSLYEMVGRISKSENIEHIRLLDKKGIVVFSSNSNEIGSVIGKHSSACLMCHASDEAEITVPSENRSRILTAENGKEVLGFTRAIYNQPACSTGECHFHASGETILGLLDISISLDEMRKKSYEYRMEFILLTCILLIFIGALLTLLSHYFVDIPVQRLVRHCEMVALGNLQSRVQVSSNDELGELTEAVNCMTESLEKADQEQRGWADSLEEKVEQRSREIKLMEEQLSRSEKFASLGTLAAGVAHEINNPLTGILLYASLIGNDKRFDPALAQDLEKVVSETSRCAGIVKNLLEFSRESVPMKEMFFVDTIIEEVINLFHMQPGFQEIEIVRSFTDGLPAVLADPHQVRQVFINLVINAGHAMPNGGELKATTYLSSDRLFVCAVISDTGCGIPEEYLAYIFDPFFTTKGEGTGLGLSISYGIVENNGGKIEVESRVGKGTAFTVMLPVSA